MLDGVADLEPGVSGVGVKNISISDPVFAGHFPKYAIYPGVLLVEACGHVCGVVENAAVAETENPTIAVLAGIRRFVFRKPVVPGDQVRIHVQRKVGAGALYEYNCRLTVDGQVVAEGLIALATVPYENPTK
ncbi:MAG: hypothetical protein FWD80_03575 [Propionibacteriaceae bacterium]|nr:hypothetical protein [Propionibacteriaceae bacterium]